MLGAGRRNITMLFELTALSVYANGHNNVRFYAIDDLTSNIRGLVNHIERKGYPAKVYQLINNITGLATFEERLNTTGFESKIHKKKALYYSFRAQIFWVKIRESFYISNELVLHDEFIKIGIKTLDEIQFSQLSLKTQVSLLNHWCSCFHSMFKLLENAINNATIARPSEEVHNALLEILARTRTKASPTTPHITTILESYGFIAMLPLIKDPVNPLHSEQPIRQISRTPTGHGNSSLVLHSPIRRAAKAGSHVSLI